MEKKYLFKHVDKTKLVLDIISYSEDQIINSQDCNMYIGIDSQYYQKYHCGYFAIVCAYHYGIKYKDQPRIGNGIHYIYHDFVDKSVGDKKDRLRKETEYLMQFVDYLVWNDFNDFSLELDFNGDSDKFSNQFIQDAKNKAISRGITDINFKPSTIACKAADHVVRTAFRGRSKVDTLYNNLIKEKAMKEKEK